MIADDLVRLAAGNSDRAIHASLGAAAAEFAQLVRRPNDLMHANPATANNGDRRLFRHHVEWTIQMIADVSDESVEVGGALNHHLHHLL